jgi:RNA polymerase primary sigma factor
MEEKMTATMTKSNVQVQNEENILAMYLGEINRIKLLTRDEEQNFARKASQGNIAARNKLVSANLRFVVNVAKKYQGQGLPLEDLISEGNIGLINAIERYDVDKGYHFISYAVWWIRQAILKAIYEKSRMIRLPLNRVNELVQIRKARYYVQEGESEIREIARLLDMSPEYVEELLAISRDMISLENPLHNEKDSSTLGDFIEATNYRSPDAHVMAMALQEDIEKLLENLNKKEADVIRYRYGLGNKTPLSLKEIGQRFNLTKERIRQIEKSAIKQLQQPLSRKVLENYVA